MGERAIRRAEQAEGEWTHTDYCDEECDVEGWEQPRHWNQPPGGYVRIAEEQLEEEGGDGAPWCRVHERAWGIIEEERRAEEADGGT